MSTMDKIPILDLTPQYRSIQKEVREAMDRVLESGAFILGPDVKAFEEEIARYLNVKHAIGVNSGTDALVIGLRAIGVEEGDEVITTPFSFFATAESISNVGATPVFADIDERTFNIDPKKIANKITSKTKAIMPVHLYGNPAAMDEIQAIADQYNLQIIEDCAQSFGATFHGKQTGTLGVVGAYSFFPSKNLGCYGDGGLIATNDDKIADLSRTLRAHGGKKKYHNEMLGYNSRLDTLQAAVLRIKLKHIDKWNQGRREVARKYNELLANTPNLITPELSEGHVFHQYTVRITNGKRDQVAAELEKQGISTMIYYPIPQHLLPVYKGHFPEQPVSEKLAAEVLSLPIWPEIPFETVGRVTKTLQEILLLRR